MVHYGFYTDQYLGSLIPEQAFAKAAARAYDALQRFKAIYQVTSSGQVAEHMALCAMAEAVYTAGKRTGGIASATVGKVSVRYDGQKNLDRELYNRAAIYLDIRRGVG